MRTITDKLIETYLTKALNRYLALDPESKQHLQALQDKIVTIELSVNQTPLYKEGKSEFQMLFTSAGIKLKTTGLSKPDTYIKGTPLSLLRMAFTSENRKNFFAEDVSIEGDLELGQQVIELFDTLDIDWEEYLSHWISDIPAHQLTRFTRKIKVLGNRLQKTLAQNINEYIHEEVDLFPPPEALQDFYHDVDTLRMDTDRLEVRIQQLTKKIAARRDHS